MKRVRKNIDKAKEIIRERCKEIGITPKEVYKLPYLHRDSQFIRAVIPIQSRLNVSERKAKEYWNVAFWELKQEE